MKKFNTAIAIVAFILPTASAHASDEKVYPGTSCQLVGDDRAGGSELHHHPGPAIFNGSDQRVVYTCPIVRDSVKLDLIRVKVRVLDDNTALDQVAECSIRTQTEEGDGLGVGSPVSSSPEVGKVLDTLNLVPPSMQDRGAYALVCKMSPQTGIRSYLVVEND